MIKANNTTLANNSCTIFCSCNTVISDKVSNLFASHKKKKIVATAMGVLTKSESDLIVESWALATPDMEKHGAAIFIKIFSEQPAVQQKYFKHMDKSDYPCVSKHGLKFMHSLDKMISLVGSGDDDQLVAAIHGIAISHKSRGILNAWEYEIVCEILMNYLKDAFGENLTPEGEDAWQKLLEILVSTIDEKLFELQN